MERRRIVNVNGSGGAWVSIRATMLIRRMIVTEATVKADASANTPQGLNYRVRKDSTYTTNDSPGFTDVFVTLPPTALQAGAIPNQIRLGSEYGAHAEKGEPIGNGPSNILGTPATNEDNGSGLLLGTHMVDVRSATVTATAVEVLEDA